MITIQLGIVRVCRGGSEAIAPPKAQLRALLKTGGLPGIISRRGGRGAVAVAAGRLITLRIAVEIGGPGRDPSPRPGLGLGLGVGLGRGEGGFGEEDADGEGGEGVDVDVLGGDAVGEGGVHGGDGLLGAGGDAERVGIVGLGLNPVLQPVLQEQLEEDAVELDSHTRHLPPPPSNLSLSLSPFPPQSLSNRDELAGNEDAAARSIRGSWSSRRFVRSRPIKNHILMRIPSCGEKKKRAQIRVPRRHLRDRSNLRNAATA